MAPARFPASCYDPPRWTAEVDGLGGELKVEPADFRVDEIPRYEFAGEGEHVLLRVEKTDVAAHELIDRVAKAFGIKARDVGAAGNKDRRATTTQWISVVSNVDPEVAELGDGVRILEHTRHRNKLKTGHLAGNRFSIRVRGLQAELVAARERLDAIFAALSEHGFPNYYGRQRFGRDASTLRLGRDMLADPGRQRRLDRRKGRLAVNAVQSAVFNEVLARRVSDRSAARVMVGDVMQKTDSGGMFLVATEEERMDAADRLAQGLLAITGPMWGPKMKMPLGAVAELEGEAAAALEVATAGFAALRNVAPGARRALMTRASGLEWEVEAVGERVDLVVSFELPPGAYATTLLREVQGS